MKIVQLAAEFAPLAKVGGLGDVVAGLSRELTRKGENVEIIIPKYDSIDLKKISYLKLEVPDFKVFEWGNPHANAIWSGESETCCVRLLEARHPAGYFHRGKIYSCDDDIPRFLYFSRACMEYLQLRNEPIDILHLHDWHVAVVALLAKEHFQLPIKAILLTIHNAEYQGLCATWDLDAIGLRGADYLVKEKFQGNDPSWPETINLLKGGIVYSDAINTVSPTYAKEILAPKAGFHLGATLRKYQAKISGILNGIDQKFWNPASDPHLPVAYNNESSIQTIVKAKNAARKSVQKKFSLSDNHRPWVGSIVRLVPQKSPELIEEGLRETIKLGGTFILLGSSSYPEIQAHFEKLKEEFAQNHQALLHFEYDEPLSHQLYAALDFVLAPSHYEPCGLTQLIAMHYGTIPIVRATGGLRDTVFDCENSAIPRQERNGFVFQRAEKGDLVKTLERAFHHFRSDPATFQSMMRRAMQIDFSWKKPTEKYLKLYRNLISKPTMSTNLNFGFASLGITRDFR